MFDREGLRDHLDGEVSTLDVVYFVAVTLSTVGYGDIVPVSDLARAIDSLFVTPVRLFIWFIFLGTAYQLVVQKVLEDFRLKKLQEKLTGHILICGFGFSGRTAAQEIVAGGAAAETILVIDNNETVLAEVAATGYLGLRGDAADRQTLADAGITKAKAIVISLGRDDTNVLAILTARQLSESVKIICTVRQEQNARLMDQAGANVVVAPSRISGYLLADGVRHTHVSDYVSDLLTQGGRVHLIERTARADEVGKALRDITDGLGVRIHRGGGCVGFWEQDKTIIEAGDVLIVIQPLLDANGKAAE